MQYNNSNVPRKLERALKEGILITTSPNDYVQAIISHEMELHNATISIVGVIRRINDRITKPLVDSLNISPDNVGSVNIRLKPEAQAAAKNAGISEQEYLSIIKSIVANTNNIANMVLSQLSEEQQRNMIETGEVLPDFEQEEEPAEIEFADTKTERDKALDAYNQGKITKEQLQTRLRMLACGRTWIKDAQETE